MDKQTGRPLPADPLTQVLSQFAASAGLSDAVIPQLTAAAVLRNYRSGDVLFRENAISKDLLLVISGSVALEMNVPGRGKARLLSLGPGDLVGWSALLGSGKMTTSAIALADTQVAAFSADAITTLCDRDPSFGYCVMRHLAVALASRLVATRLQLLDLFADSTPLHPIEPQRIDACQLE